MFHPTLDPQLVGEVIAARRKKKGISQEVLSGLADIGRTHCLPLSGASASPPWRLSTALPARWMCL